MENLRSHRPPRIQNCFKFFAFLLLFLSPLAQAEKPELVIYAYDSFLAKGGMGPEIFPIFEKKCDCKVRAVGVGDGGQLLTRLQLDSQQDRPTAHVVIGLDQTTWPRAKQWTESWGEWVPRGYDQINPAAVVEKGFLPFDFGIFAFIADKKLLAARHLEVPKSFSDLMAPGWKRNILLQDPRTSTPGTAFLLYTHQIKKKSVWDFWLKFRSQWLTLTPGWESAYGLFLKKEAPLVWSYTTSQAYHEEHGDSAIKDSRRYVALIFYEGHPMQIEGAAFVKGALKSPWDRDRARQFMEFLLSPEVQEMIPKKNWMFPSVKATALPESFKHVPKPHRLVQVPAPGQEVDQILTEWARTIEAAR